MSTKDGEYDESQGILKLNKVTLNDVGSYACVANTSGHQPVISTNAHLYVESENDFPVISFTTNYDVIFFHVHSQAIMIWDDYIIIAIVILTYIVSAIMFVILKLLLF